MTLFADTASWPLLSFIVFFPLVGAIVVAFAPRSRSETARTIGLVFTGVTFGLTIYLMIVFATNHGGFQWVESRSWIPAINVHYQLAVDGFSLFMVALTGFLFPLMLIGSRHITKRVKHFTIWLLILEGTQMGVFLATDLFMFFVFWELTLVPIYFLIAYWGGENRRNAARKFFIYTVFGSAFLLAAIVGAGVLSEGGISFDYENIFNTEYSMAAERLLFWGFTIAFLFKVPIVPLHTWLPDAHTAAPTAGSADLAGVLLKIGAYGLLQFSLPLFPRAAVEAVPILLTLAVIGIVYTALVAIRQKDAKRLIAYTSISHLGFIIMGIFAITSTGIEGGVMQMLNHGIVTAGLFFLIGFFYDRRHTHKISEFGGIKAVMPKYAAFFMVFMLASMGVPGLNSFVGEMLTLFGTFVVHRWWAIVAVTGIVLVAIYMLWLYQRMFNGPLDNPKNMSLKDLRPHEVFVMVPMVVVMLFLGIYPKPVLDRIGPTADRLVVTIEAKTADTPQQYIEPAETASGRDVAFVADVLRLIDADDAKSRAVLERYQERERIEALAQTAGDSDGHDHDHDHDHGEGNGE